MVKPPISRIGPAKKVEVSAVIAASPVAGKYDETVDRESAFERLSKRGKQAADEAAETKPKRTRTNPAPKPRGRQRQGFGEAFVKSMVRSLGSRAGRALVRGVLGSLFKGR